MIKQVQKSEKGIFNSLGTLFSFWDGFFWVEGNKCSQFSCTLCGTQEVRYLSGSLDLQAFHSLGTLRWPYPKHFVQEAGNSNGDLVPMCSSNDFQTGSALESNKPKVYCLPGPKTQMERYGTWKVEHLDGGTFGVATAQSATDSDRKLGKSPSDSFKKLVEIFY